jgi:NAD+ kinase
VTVAAREPRARLDRILVERGLAPTRARAQALVLAGRVSTAGLRLDKPGLCYPLDVPLEVAPGPRWVSRGGEKLDAALAALGVRAAERDALDVGASTGGFTQVLLQHGARRVIALDVGRGQLDWSLRNDPRVLVLEGRNARRLDPADLPFPPSLATVDVSFISLRLVLAPLVGCVTADGDVIALVKPQFEVGRAQVGRGGIVRDRELHRDPRRRGQPGVLPAPAPGRPGHRRGGRRVSTQPVAKTPIRRVVVVAKIGRSQAPRLAAELARWLEERGIEVQYDAETAAALGVAGGASRETLPDAVDLAIVAGGDGTLLSVARAAGPRGVPLLGVNLGGLGFLTELHPDELYAGLEAVLRGEYTIEQRRALRVRFARAGQAVREYALLNDVVITKSALARMIDIGVRVDGQEVATYTSDGLIVSTPTGSTAYNLSAGGPILDPRMSAFVIAPICPHTLTHRPIVVPGDVRIEIALRSSEGEVYLTLDGQIGSPFAPEDRLTIDDHPRPVRLVRVARRGFFEVLRRKLRWGER